MSRNISVMDDGELLLTAVLLIATLLIFWRVLLAFVLLLVGTAFMVGVLQMAYWISQRS